MFVRCSRVASIPARSFCVVRHRGFATAPSSPEAYLTHSTSSPGISFLNLSRPASKNAISLRLLTEFRAALDEVRASSQTRALILQSAVPGVFCAGADLKERRTMNSAQIAVFLRTLRLTLGELSDIPVPTIAALDGVALGGGLELALACDFRIAGREGKLALPETRLAIIPGAGGTQRLVRLIGPTRAKELIFSGRALGGLEAERIGIVSYVADEGQTASERAVLLAEEFLPAGPLAIKAAKRAIDVGSQLDMESGLDFEAVCYETIMPSRDRLEGLAAFAQKRKPVYIGE